MSDGIGAGWKSQVEPTEDKSGRATVDKGIGWKKRPCGSYPNWGRGDPLWVRTRIPWHEPCGGGW